MAGVEQLRLGRSGVAHGADAPVGAAPEQPVADEAVLYRAGGRGDAAIVLGLRRSAAVAEGGERHAQQRHRALPALGAPHPLAGAVLAQQNGEVARRLQERQRVDRHAGGLQRGRRRPAERDAKHRRAGPGFGRVVAPAGPTRRRSGPDIHRLLRHVEHPPRRAEHRGRLAGHPRARQVAGDHAVQRERLAGRELVVGAKDAGGRQDALECRRRRRALPAPHAGQHLPGRRAPGPQQHRCVEDEPVADQAARVVARGVIVVAAQVIGRAVDDPAVGAQLEEADLGAAARVAVADHDHRRAGDQQLVVPGTRRVAAGCVGVDGGHGLERAGADAHREQPAAAQDHQVVAGALDDAALIDAGGLHVGDRLGRGHALGAGLGRRRRHGCGGIGQHAGGRLAAACAQALRTAAPAVEHRHHLRLAGVGGQRAAGGRGGDRRGHRAADEAGEAGGQDESSRGHG